MRNWAAPRDGSSSPGRFIAVFKHRNLVPADFRIIARRNVLRTHVLKPFLGLVIGLVRAHDKLILRRDPELDSCPSLTISRAVFAPAQQTLHRSMAGLRASDVTRILVIGADRFSESSAEASISTVAGMD